MGNYRTTSRLRHFCNHFPLFAAPYAQQARRISGWVYQVDVLCVLSVGERRLVGLTSLCTLPSRRISFQVNKSKYNFLATGCNEFFLGMDHIPLKIMSILFSLIPCNLVHCAHTYIYACAIKFKMVDLEATHLNLKVWLCSLTYFCWYDRVLFTGFKCTKSLLIQTFSSL